MISCVNNVFFSYLNKQKWHQTGFKIILLLNFKYTEFKWYGDIFIWFANLQLYMGLCELYIRQSLFI